MGEIADDFIDRNINKEPPISTIQLGYISFIEKQLNIKFTGKNAHDAQEFISEHLKNKITIKRNERIGKTKKWIDSTISFIEMGIVIFVYAKDEEQGFDIYTDLKSHYQNLEYNHSYKTIPMFPHGETKIYQGINLFKSKS